MNNVLNAFIYNGLLVVFIGLILSGCTGTQPNTSADFAYFDAAQEAIDRQDWESAYRLLEDYLAADDQLLRNKSNELVRKYPKIRQAAFKTFSKDSLESTYKDHGERAWLIEKKRLSMYQHFVTSQKQYEEALKNYHDFFDEIISKYRINKQANKVFESELLDSYQFEKVMVSGMTYELTQSVKIGETTRKKALLLFGRPSSTFENNKILTWAIRIEGEKFTILKSFIRYKGRVTHSLVMVFDEAYILRNMALVKVFL